MIKRLNRFLNWAEGWLQLITILMLVAWNISQTERINRLQDRLEMWTEGLVIINEKHLRLHEMEADVHDQIIERMGWDDENS